MIVQLNKPVALTSPGYFANHFANPSQGSGYIAPAEDNNPQSRDPPIFFAAPGKPDGTEPHWLQLFLR